MLTKVLLVISLDALFLSLFHFSFFVSAGTICASVIIQMSDTISILPFKDGVRCIRAQFDVFEVKNLRNLCSV